MLGLFDPMYFVIVGPAMLFAVWAQMKVKGAFGKWSQIGASSGMTGAQAANHMLQHAGIRDVKIEPSRGMLSDHYDPRAKAHRARYDANAGSEVTFLMTIARRRLIDRARRLGRRISADLLEDPTTIPSPASQDTVELHDEVARAQEALEKLRPEQREVLDLALGQGQTHQEIAASIGIPLGTVKSHARRGLIKLREMLGADQPAGETPVEQQNPEPSKSDSGGQA